MNSPRIRIRFDGNGRTYGPGEILSGEYWLDSMPDDGVRTIEVSVLWYTEGKGDEDLGVHDFRRVAIEENGDGRVPRPGLDCPGRFSTTLPNSPLTYCGVILRVRWCVRVRVLLARGKEIVDELEFRLGDVPTVRASGVGYALGPANQCVTFRSTTWVARPEERRA